MAVPEFPNGINVSAGPVTFPDGSVAGSALAERGPIIYLPTLSDCINTASEVDVLSVAIPANAWADGHEIRLTWIMARKNISGSAATLTLKLKWGATEHTLNADSLINSGVETRFRIELMLIRIGTSIFVEGWEFGTQMRMSLHPASMSGTSGTDVFASGRKGVELTGQSFSSTTSLKISAQWSGADIPSPNAWYTVKQATIVRVPGAVL